MLNSLKRNIQNFMTRRYVREYNQALYVQRNAYDIYAQQQEECMRAAYENKERTLTAHITTAQKLAELMADMDIIREDILIVADDEGVLNSIAETAVLCFFQEHPECSLLYADEDISLGAESDFSEMRRSGVKLSERCCPNFKPIPSPETFLSYQYFGNIWAVRMDVCRKIQVSADADCKMYEYAFLFRIWKEVGISGIAHLPQILFHKFVPYRVHENGKCYTKEEMERVLFAEDFYWGNETCYNGIKEAYCKGKGLQCAMVTEQGCSYPIYELEEEPFVSILIPSKDNPEVLANCISSVVEKSTYQNYEIIVIDNGSTSEHKAETEQLKEKYPFTYLYRPMEFNYSKMNNIAAKEAKGNVLLLLNDDMEVITPDWMERMAGQLMQDGIGAVGAKLLYPETTLIQHVGITNAVDGPVHKLLKKDDSVSYHHGRNKLVYNVLGVTGACLMVRKSDYERMGGLKEELQVAYNDVDLCFSLFEDGLRNVIRNDVILYHHESLSRGADVISVEKMARLKKERDYLYQCHPDLYYKDPYEGANNVGGADFGVNILPDYEKERKAEERPVPCDKDYTTHPSGIHVWIDRAERDAFIRVKDKALYVMEGFCVLPESDNCRYIFKLILQGKDKAYCMPIEKKLRPNISGGFPNARNVELSGFQCWFTEGELPEGEYQIGIYTADRCSRQKLFQDTGIVLTVGN